MSLGSDPWRQFRADVAFTTITSGFATIQTLSGKFHFNEVRVMRQAGFG
jgi:hypothetical protein